MTEQPPADDLFSFMSDQQSPTLPPSVSANQSSSIAEVTTADQAVIYQDQSQEINGKDLPAATYEKEEPAVPGKKGISQINVSQEMRTSFLEYAYSVIYARALPDARDGLKPVQRRILYMMEQMGLRPDRGHVKSQRVVGEVMGKLHPHGDSAIYETLVRLAQPFNLHLPLVDGHGNFGSLDDGPAASRYTEARLAASALDMVTNLSEEVVDFVPNYDNQFLQPEVLPAGFPNLLVNGTSGIAVGMATNIPPHNLGETVAGAIHLLHNPQATVEELMAYIPGPDLPGGGVIVGLDGIRDAYQSGRGIFKTRAKAHIERVSARKRGIIVTELPYLVGPERVIEKIKEAVNKGRIKGISAVTNLTDRKHDLRLVIEVKNGFNPDAILAALYKYTPMEESFGINAVSLVNGQPKTLGLKEMLQVFLDHRMEIVWRRCQYRLKKRQDRLHLVNGLLIAVLDIDDVIAIIRSSDQVEQARSRLMEAFDLDQVQAEHILSLQLRRLTKFSRLELESERDQLTKEISELEFLLESENARRDLVTTELREVAKRHNQPRRTLLIEDGGLIGTASSGAVEAAATTDNSAQASSAGTNLATLSATAGASMAGLGLTGDSTSLEIPDDPCLLTLSASGLLARFNAPAGVGLPLSGPRQAWDAVKSQLSTTARATVGVITNQGRLHKLQVVETPVLPLGAHRPSLRGGIAASALLNLASQEVALGLVSLDSQASPWWLVTEQGTVKRSRPEILTTQEVFDVISLTDDDQLVAAGQSQNITSFTQIEEETNPLEVTDSSVNRAEADLVLITSGLQLLRTSADKIRPQGRLAGGVAGMKLSTEDRVIAAALIENWQLPFAHVTTIVGCGDAIKPGELLSQSQAHQTSVKTTPLALYPVKGRAGQGICCQRLLKQETTCLTAAITLGVPRALDALGAPILLPPADQRRNGSGTKIPTQVEYLG